jgi:NAD(P)-dependent dehydrogenase (short-subunit alcohol dehydrogenase family)
MEVELGTLEGKRTLITGAATGIGRATTIRVASEGAPVAALDVNDEEAASTLKTVADAGGRARYWHADVSCEQEVRHAVEEAADWLGGGIDVLLHLAGVLKGAHVEVTELSEEMWDSVIDVNLKGSFLVVKHVATQMIRQGSGVIVLTSSGAGVLGSGSSYAYSSSKGGTLGLALTLDQHLSRHGIRVNDVSPGSIDTPLKVAATEESYRNTGDREAYDRTIRGMSPPEGVAAVLAFLASDDASYIRGSIRTI